jgi:hypothetical protein
MKFRIFDKFQGSKLGSGSIISVLNATKELRTVVIGYSIAPQPQKSTSFVMGQNISTTAARNTGGLEVPISIRVTGTEPLEVSLLLSPVESHLFRNLSASILKNLSSYVRHTIPESS